MLLTYLDQNNLAFDTTKWAIGFFFCFFPSLYLIQNNFKNYFYNDKQATKRQMAMKKKPSWWRYLVPLSCLYALNQGSQA